MKETGSDKVNNEYQNLVFHPYNVALTLVLLGISALFLAFSAAFIYTRVQGGLPAVKLPGIFFFNTTILMVSSWTLVRAKKAFKNDDTAKYQRALLFTIILSVIFLLFQVIGWRSLFRQDIFPTSDNSAAYLYLISGLHFVHLIAGIPFLCMFLWKSSQRMKEEVSVLVYFSDPEKRLSLRLLSMYWHFLDGLWIYLLLFFWFNYLCAFPLRGG